MNLRTEVAVAYRTLGRHRMFAITAVLSLAVAIGLNTTMYSTIDALLSPRVELRDPSRLLRIRFFGDTRHQVTTRQANALLRSADDIFEEFTSAKPQTLNGLVESDGAFLNGPIVTVLPNFFAVIGAHPRYGRVFDSTDVTAASLPVVLSERAARRLFEKLDNPVGQTVHLEGVPYTVVGVIPREAGVPRDLTLAWVLPPQNADLAEVPLTIVRTRAGLTPAQMSRGWAALEQRFAVAADVAPRDVGLRSGGFIPAQAHMEVLHYALIAAVLAVLLVACANIANLQLARGIARSRELATRAALGASRKDLVMHLLTESALIGAAGLVLGLVLTFWGMHVTRAVLPDSIGEYIVEPQTSWRLFAFAAVAAAVCVILIGLVPAIRVSRVDVNELLKRGAGTGATRSARRQYGLLVAAEIAFALPVLCGAALLVRAALQSDEQAKLWNRSMLSETFVRVNLSRGTTKSFAELAADITSSLRGKPDIAEMTVVSSTPDADGVISGTINGGAPHEVPVPMWSYDVVTPSAMRTYGFSLLHGRDFRDGEQDAVAIISASLAGQLWPGGSAVGQMIKFGSLRTPGRWYTVVGVRQPVTLAASDEKRDAYVLAGPGDNLIGYDEVWKRPTVQVVERASANPQRLPVTTRHALASDAQLTVLVGRSLDQLEEAGRANANFIGALFTVFAALALGLAAIGIYGIVSHAVAERRRELGVRIALGATRRNIRHAVMREGNVFVLSGVAIGLWLLMRMVGLLRGFLDFPEADVYSIELYIPAAVLLFSTALAAALVPAQRAARIDPVEAMRCE